METMTIEGPDWAASYLINGDASGLSAEDRARVDAWLRRERIVAVLDCEDEPRFTWSYALHFPEGQHAGGNVLTYLCRVLD